MVLLLWVFCFPAADSKVRERLYAGLVDLNTLSANPRMLQTLLVPLDQYYAPSRSTMLIPPVLILSRMSVVFLQVAISRAFHVLLSYSVHRFFAGTSPEQSFLLTGITSHQIRWCPFTEIPPSYPGY